MAEQIHKGPPFGHTIQIEFWPTPITHPFRSEEKGKVAAFLPPPQSSPRIHTRKSGFQSWIELLLSPLQDRAYLRTTR